MTASSTGNNRSELQDIGWVGNTGKKVKAGDIEVRRKEGQDGVRGARYRRFKDRKELIIL